MKTFCYYFLFNEYSEFIKQNNNKQKNISINNKEFIKNNRKNDKLIKKSDTSNKTIDPFYFNYLHNFFIIY